MTSDEGESVEDQQRLFERIRSRLEKDADVLRLTDRRVMAELLHRVAKLAAEEAHGQTDGMNWENARSRPLARPEYDDPRDVLIGRLARILGVADGGHHAASYSSMISAAQRLRADKTCAQGS